MPFPKVRDEMAFELYRFRSNAVCRGCQRPIEWWWTGSGKLIPMDPMPEGSSPAIAHWATCPHAKTFKGGKK
jgi:hypothetical protein